MTTAPTVCVYCGSRGGESPGIRDAAVELGTHIGQQGWQLVYGGGRAGLMGLVADAAIAAGARVTGVIPESLMQRELGHPGLHELHVVQTMHERKRLMADRADAFVALPGGIGTFEELFEVWSWRHLAYHDRPIALLDVEHYFEPLLVMLRRTVAAGFMTAEQMAMIDVDADPARLLRALAVKAARATAPDDLRRI
ncbi:MAG: TIGR00730 family Rossman fold protein [Burkholderiaceae bacterium]|nr:TIGR00730 family Rossman fold protein [Burkholderiaceae bacterium]